MKTNTTFLVSKQFNEKLAEISEKYFDGISKQRVLENIVSEFEIRQSKLNQILKIDDGLIFDHESAYIICKNSSTKILLKSEFPDITFNNSTKIL